MSLESKLRCLLETLKTMPSCAVAFSGGVDSTVLLAAVVKMKGDSVLAVTVTPPYFPRWELEDALTIGESLGVRHKILDMETPRELEKNPEERCYLCKRLLFSRIKAEAAEQGIHEVLDGSNAEDISQYRPGMKALKEMTIRSPLLECGFTKKDIRSIAAQWKLPVADKPAYSCLLTRIPHGKTVSNSILRRIEQGENYLRKQGFQAVRVRNHGKLARIEVDPRELPRFLDPKFMKKVDTEFKQLGYRFVSLDCGGYKTGNMDPQ